MREQFHWSVQLQRDDGQISEHKVSAYWTPSQDETVEAVKNTAQAEAYWRSGKQHKFVPISAQLLEA